MSCAEEIASGLGRPRRNVLATSQNHTQIPYVVVVAPLDDLADKKRSSRRQFRFVTLDLRYRKDLADKVVDLVMKDPNLKYLKATDDVADQFSNHIVGDRIRGNVKKLYVNASKLKNDNAKT
jgi:hypothetical protein